ncbi:MAG TPA: 50S ribosomal protein L22 [Niabella sp.]|jgi:large subunit ribosomal protein L22|nr:50S ribosomal protein L22 [Chitinophagaceae bacterium]HRN48030.1 50S ribosomal protein L22 [Niabella sp.]HRO85968.1 50S ribosomal protein L22 [Niabella sp.]
MEAVAKLRNYPTSPRKMRLLADLIRGKKVDLVLAELEHNPKHPAVPLRKLVLNAINNWKQVNEGGDETSLIIKTIFVDEGRTLKRMRPAPQGRGYKIRKRSNHVTIIVDERLESDKKERKSNTENVKSEVKKAPAKKTKETKNA